MKQYFLILALILISAEGFSQSVIGLTVSPADPIANDDPDLTQFLWGYSKNKPAKNEKRLIDFNTIDNWRGLGNYLAVSDDGEFFAYTINKPTSSFRYAGMLLNDLDSLVVQSTHNTWRKAFVDANPGFFTGNSKQYVFQQNEILWFLQTGNSQTRSVKNVVSYKMSPNVRDEWVAWQLKNEESEVVLHNLVTGRENRFSGVSEYQFDKSGEWLACEINSNSDKTERKELLLYNLVKGKEKRFPFVAHYSFSSSGKALLLKIVEKTNKETTTALQYINLQGEPDVKIIWSTKNEKVTVSSSSIDDLGKQVVFSILDSSNAVQDDLTNTSIWYYKEGMDKAVLKVTTETPGISDGLTIKSTGSFTDNGRYVRFALQLKPDAKKKNPTIAQVEVWSHQDLYLQSAQSEQLKRPEQFDVIVNIENGKVIPLESNDKRVYLLQGDFAIVKKLAREKHRDRFWEKSNEDSTWVVSLKDGSNQLLTTKSENHSFWFSPGGNYLVFFDPDKGCHYFSYNLHSGILKDISANVPNGHLGAVNRYKRTNQDPESPNGLAAWLANDIGVLVYDNYDIWRLDLTGKGPAINITNGFGKSNNTILNLLTTYRFYGGNHPVIRLNEALLLRAFNTKNKQYGFYRKADINADTPKLEYMGRYFMEHIPACHDPNLSNRGMEPVKVRNRDTWIVQRQSSTDAPNYYETTNFKSFRRLTNIQPQKNFKWLSEELHSFNHLDGNNGQGILYKPEDFDPTKKYPVMIVFYGAFSNNLYQFRDPSYNFSAESPGRSPLWFLNNGYLVFTPDIYVAPLKYGPEAYNVIQGAAKYLQHLPYVDANKLGCASHSWSAKLGAYIFTHSQSIAATAISEGYLYADLINVALSTKPNGTSHLESVEKDFQFGNLWENKDLWLDQTTVLNVDKVKSPLLLFCNKESDAEYQNQTLQFFTALRRLDKNVWWLKYDKGDHTLSDPKELKDYTIRYTQFFDHYLQEAPAPRWMTHGIPLKLKGIESRYGLDPVGNCGPADKPCPICEAWNKQHKRTPEMFQKEIKDWLLDSDVATELERKINERRKQLDKEGEIQQREVLKKLNVDK